MIFPVKAVQQFIFLCFEKDICNEYYRVRIFHEVRNLQFLVKPA